MLKDKNGTVITTHRGGSIRGIKSEKIQRMLDFIEGGVWTWCVCPENKGKQFALRDLFGGANFDWNETPLQELHDKHLNEGRTDADAWDCTRKDAGRLLKRVLIEDKREYVEGDAGMAKGYTWIK